MERKLPKLLKRIKGISTDYVTSKILGVAENFSELKYTRKLEKK